MMASRVTVHGGAGARVQAAIIEAVARLSRPFHHRGVQRITWALAPHFGPENQAVIRIGRGVSVRLYLHDGYWTKLLDPRFRYEPETDWALGRVLTRDTLFLDCGANIGLWSLLAQDRAARVVAVEANPRTFAMLQDNLRLNDAAVVPLPAAVWRASGDRLSISGEPRKHAGASVTTALPASPPASWTSAEVDSVTIDTLVDDYAPDGRTPVVVKLDVEGAEIAAVDGAARTLRDREVVLLYEDHGKDPSCAVTGHLLDLGMQIHGAWRTSRMTLAEVAATKRNPTKGYNFAACAPGSSFAARLLAP
jgi:FkbM family methyltransferase